MAASDRDWAAAYARQALSDLQALELLSRAQADKCHRLHFLQMAAEKVCKAHLSANNGHERVRKTHGYIARNLLSSHASSIRAIALVVSPLGS